MDKNNKKVSGNSNLQFDNDNGAGLQVNVSPHFDTDFTDSGFVFDQWAAFNGSSRSKDYAQDWGNTLNATFDITGVQVEVAEKATDFEHRTFADELAKCQRYFLMFKPETSTGVTHAGFFNGGGRSTTAVYGVVHFPQEMRLRPALAYSGTLTFYFYNSSRAVNSIAVNGSTNHSCELNPTVSSISNLLGSAGWLRIQANAYITFDAEI